MAQSRKTNPELVDENQRLRAQVAQLEDQLDHLSEHGAAAKALQQSEALHREVMSVVSDVVLIADEAGRLTYVSPNAHFIFGHAAADILKQGRVGFVLPGELFDPDLLEQRGEISNIECQIRDAVGRARNLLVTVRRIDSTARHDSVRLPRRDRANQDRARLRAACRSRWSSASKSKLASCAKAASAIAGWSKACATNTCSTPPIRSGIITYVSPSIHTILGYTPDQVIGRQLARVCRRQRSRIPRTGATGADAICRNSRRRCFRPRFRTPTAKFECSNFATCRCAIADGKVIANEGIGKDVTQRHEAEEALRKAHEELERSRAGADRRAHGEKRTASPKPGTLLARSFKTTWSSSFAGATTACERLSTNPIAAIAMRSPTS